MTTEMSERAQALSAETNGIKRRMLIRFGVATAALSGASTMSALSAGRAEATVAEGVSTGYSPTALTDLSATIADVAYVPEASRPRRPNIDSMVEQFAAGHGWTNFSSTAASVTDDRVDFTRGTQSLKFTTKTDNSAGSVQKSGYALNLTSKMMVIWVKVTGAANITELLLYAGDSTLANHYSWTVADAGGVEQHVFREGEWAPLVLSFADAATVGTPNRGNIITLRVRARATKGKAVTVNLGGIGVAAEPASFPHGVISLTCDDSYATQYNVMRPALDKFGWSATAYTIVDLLGTPGFMTIDQLKSLEQTSGWEIAGHAYTSDMHSAGYGATSTLEAIEADVLSLRRWLLANKFKGADHLAYPKGYFTTESQAVIGKYFATARTVTNRLAETIRPSDRMRLRSLSVTNTIPLSTAKAFVDKIKRGKGWGIITIHDLVANPSNGAQWATADFMALLDYISAAGIPVMNVSEVANRLNQPDAISDTANVVADATARMGAIVHAALGNAPGRLHAIRRDDAVASIATTSGRADIVCFTPAVDMTITRLTALSAAAWTGHTLARIGLYTVDSAGNATLAARTASDPTLFSVANTVYQKALDGADGFPSSYILRAGGRYAVAVIGVGQSSGQLRGHSAPSVLAQRPPVMGGKLGTGLPDLPATGIIDVTGNYPWAELAT